MPYQEKPELTEEDKARLDRDFGKLYRESSRGGENGSRVGNSLKQPIPVETVSIEGSSPSPCISGSTSDGYHTFDELYEHRHTLWIALCRTLYFAYCDHAMPSPFWRTSFHSDGSAYEGWFLLGMYTEPGKQITYHLPQSQWNQCSFAAILERAPEFDGHTSADVLERIAKL